MHSFVFFLLRRDIPSIADPVRPRRHWPATIPYQAMGCNTSLAILYTVFVLGERKKEKNKTFTSRGACDGDRPSPAIFSAHKFPIANSRGDNNNNHKKKETKHVNKKAGEKDSESRTSGKPSHELRTSLLSRHYTHQTGGGYQEKRKKKEVEVSLKGFLRLCRWVSYSSEGGQATTLEPFLLQLPHFPKGFIRRKMEVALRLASFILLIAGKHWVGSWWNICLMTCWITAICGEDAGPAQSFPALWTRRHKRQAGFGITSGSSSALTPYNQRLDASEWLERLLGSLEEPSSYVSYGGSSDARTSEGQRIFQREARPSQFVQPAAKKRFSLASIRIDPNSLKRQYIYPTPNMALIQLENHVRFPSEDIPGSYINGSGPQQRPSIVNERKPQRQQVGSSRPSSRPNFAAEESSPETPRQKAIDVDVYLNYYPWIFFGLRGVYTYLWL